ncbi:MAG: ROK family protein [Candidatus Diapherotrites archaeon]
MTFSKKPQKTRKIIPNNLEKRKKAIPLKAVGVDIGGTKILAVLVSSNGRILRECKVKTPATEGKALLALEKAICWAKGSEKITGIGIGFAGFIDSEQGIVIESPNMPSIKKAKVKSFLEKKFKCKVCLENDANMFALGEWFFGFGAKHKNFAALTIGTGIGSGVIENGKLLKGKGIAPEFGHTIIQAKGGRKCKCGNTGCFEAQACGSALLERANSFGLNSSSGEEIAKKAKTGNKKAIKAIKETAHYLGIGLANFANAFDPEIIVIGGGLSNIPLLLREAEKEMQKHVVVKKRARVCKEKLEGKGAALGAALCALNGFLPLEKKPVLAVDCILEFNKGIVLLKRNFKPKGWALPGGIVEYGESLEKAIEREVLEETNLKIKGLKQFKAYSAPERDPRWHSVTVVFTGKGIGRIKKSRESEKVSVFNTKSLPKLAFDHQKILADWAKEHNKKISFTFERQSKRI